MEENTGCDYLENPTLTEVEKQILESYDHLQVLQLEIEFLQTCAILSTYDPLDNSGSDLEVDIEAAQSKLLQATATFQIRQNIIESVLIANPIICAVHAGTRASTEQQVLYKLLRKRDDLSLALTQISKKLTDARDELIKVQVENMHLGQKNTELTAQMLKLAEKTRSSTTKNIELPQARQKLDLMETAVRISRQRWKEIKGVASGSIVGSGVDWTRDSQLLQIVVDED